MKCDACKNELEYVVVVSECWQKGDLNGNKIVDYSHIEEIMETIRIECPFCGNELKNVIEG